MVVYALEKYLNDGGRRLIAVCSSEVIADAHAKDRGWQRTETPYDYDVSPFVVDGTDRDGVKV